MHPLIILGALAFAYAFGAGIGMQLHERLNRSSRGLVFAVSILLCSASLARAWTLPSFTLFCVAALLLGVALRTLHRPWL